MKTYELPNQPETLEAGHAACAGCGLMPAVRLIQRCLGPKTVYVAPACCFSVINGQYPFSAIGVPLVNCAFETAAITASGVRAGFDVQGIVDTTVVALAGDGGTFDIGFGALSAAAERNEDILYICYDNEAYMNTGIQRSSATPIGAWTTTTPQGALKGEAKKDIGAIMAAHRIPYFATASIAWPEDFSAKLLKAKETKGFRMIHYLCPCPTGWHADPKHMITLARLAVESRVFPLYEVFDGKRWALNVNSSGKGLEDYLKLQGRFKYMTPEQARMLRGIIEERWEQLIKNLDS
ncbi:MAG: thiamine pyrophosphate-dependent enzyme [Elusimicrobiota bacterium]